MCKLDAITDKQTDIETDRRSDGDIKYGVAIHSFTQSCEVQATLN